MIVGVGVDVVVIDRIARLLERYGRRFVGRVFTEGERRRCDGRRRRVEGYARRFAAKEACAKALGTGLRGGVFWRDMEVCSLPSGRPVMRLSGGAAARLGVLVAAPMTAHIRVSLADDAPLAVAYVVIEAFSMREAGC